MSVDTFNTMPIQDVFTWVNQLDLPDSEDGVDDFNMLDELINIDVGSGLFADCDSLLPEADLGPLEDLLSKDLDLVRHDCMWAGTCVDHKELRPDPTERLNPHLTVKSTLITSKDSFPETSVQPARAVVRSNNQRSLLRTSTNSAVTTVNSVRYQTRTASHEESDDSIRPDTPPYTSEGEEQDQDDDSASHPNSMYGDQHLDDDDDDDEDDDEEDEDDDDEDEPEVAIPLSDVTGRQIPSSKSFEVSSSPGRPSRMDTQHQSKPALPPQPFTQHFISDHSYHQSKVDVSATIPGNLTPSDSEEEGEIDVVSVIGDKGACSRSSSQGAALPTNPSASDRRVLQQTVASAIKKSSYPEYPSHGRRASTSFQLWEPSGRQSGKLARMHQERQRQRERKRRNHDRDYSSEEDVRPTKKRAKHHVYKSKRAQNTRVSSSDSEPDSCEKRSLHNNMERQRRVDLRNAFEDLRVVVPNLYTNARAAKVVILKEASQFCRKLTDESRHMTQEAALLKREQERLLARVSHLRKQFAISYKK